MGERKRPPTNRRTKRAKRDSKDQFSCLPDCVLIHILSLVDVKDAVKTSILSRRWRQLWMYIDSLVFGESPGTLYQDKFVGFVDRSLSLYRGNRLKKFQISLSKNPISASTINNWIHNALARGVEDLDLRFPCDSPYQLPDNQSAYQSLQALKLYNCRLSPASIKCFSSLKSLSLRSHYTLLADERIRDNNVFQSIISNCTVLEHLELIDDCILTCLDFSTSNRLLKRLEIESAYGSAPNSVEISAPNLTSLEFRGCLVSNGYLLNNLSSLVQCSLKFNRCRADQMFANSPAVALINILRKLQRVKVLVISRWCIQALSVGEASRLHMPYLNIKYLKLEMGGTVPVEGTLLLLKNCSKLETLIIKTEGMMTPIHSDEMPDEREHLGSEELLPCMGHLKTVQVFQVLGNSITRGWKYGEDSKLDLIGVNEKSTSLMRTLLAKSVVLEKMVISTRLSQTRCHAVRSGLGPSSQAEYLPRAA
ncbi:F-box protein At5g03100-like [Aristolochia californica]|uniref:F-box protein At5g03100-like n=1 Tax=Aristolochia californica TaxID=171875 RepID=UPI0035DBDD67